MEGNKRRKKERKKLSHEAIRRLNDNYEGIIARRKNLEKKKCEVRKIKAWQLGNTNEREKREKK